MCQLNKQMSEKERNAVGQKGRERQILAKVSPVAVLDLPFRNSKTCFFLHELKRLRLDWLYLLGPRRRLKSMAIDDAIIALVFIFLFSLSFFTWVGTSNAIG